MPDSGQRSVISPPLVQSRLDGHPFGDPLIHIPSCESTNDVLWVEIKRGAGTGTVVTADCQTMGRGRSGSRWISPTGKDLLLSVAVPWEESQLSGYLSIWAAVSVAEMLMRDADVAVLLKWPNDVIANGKKIGGVMAETRAGYSLAVVGIGLNVSSQASDRPPELRDRAISLCEIHDRAWDRNILLAGILNSLGDWWQRLNRDGWPVLYRRWMDLCSTVGCAVQLTHGAEILAGIVEGIDLEGCLVLREMEGKQRRFRPSEITGLVPLEELPENGMSLLHERKKNDAGGTESSR
ncbi:MAG TPA: biotin--[acetyl-CoA-carboxylase] ligase [bacterium]|nr:biotin--[acetyl-CoA-carboxylase] ligase [bacterium]HQO34288.1 biotin--[acetyl-CoA-carboxylase] ligase [bacterium]